MDNFNCSCNSFNNNLTKNEMLNQIMSLNFAINDLTLYLDTHPTDSRAICMHNEYSQRSSALTEEYQKKYGPLTVNFTSNTWDWINEPWPWERSVN